MNDDMDLTDVDLTNEMRRLTSMLPSEAGAKVEQQLLAGFRARHRQRNPVWMYVAAAALFCVALFAGLKFFGPKPAAAPPAYNASAFTALPYAESGVPMESAVVIRVQMRSSQLTAIGVLLPAEPAATEFKADLLVGQDGVPRAVRLVQ